MQESLRRRCRSTLHALASALSVVCLTAPLHAHAETTLYVANVGGSNEQLYRQKVIPPFEKAHDVKIVYVAGNSSDTLAKLQAQKGHQQINVAVMDDGPMYQAMQLGLCAKVEDAPVMKDLYPLARLGPTAVGVGMVATGIGYNEEAFKKLGLPAPDSWQALTDKRLKGKLGVPPITNTYGLHTLVMLARLNGGGEKNIDPGFNAMTKQVAPDVLSWAPTPGEMDGLMQAGDVIIAPYGSGRAVALQNTGFPLKFVYPKEGGVALQVAACALAENAQPMLSQAFIQYLLSPEVQAMQAQAIGLGPVNKTVKLTPEVAARVPYGPEQVSKLTAMDWATINQHRTEWTERWNRSVER
ncbi:ABC transporter substrate-binding protein [Paraburkholderia phymatum]|uniref:Extracellular solute-binding protein family 1 n=1 Tax=Paraburkholderia phymatum (strain DSM 17167 / CIP 108236 / LMG 21445 / STM815) TaxID=391038 RepID=B2JU01_PARP8|nr:ABC transporter substrate-binding protein [Paraburkholderia phymatum]ACC76054.1 extracellular solute-binding protein family 1 [Paraburkholderia phymatum STM815]